MARKPVAQVIADHAPTLMALPGVQAVYEAALPDGNPVIRVIVLTGEDATARRIPGTIEGYPVEVERSGPIRPLGSEAR